MKTIPTAEEFSNSKGFYRSRIGNSEGSITNYDVMIEFAKLHVTEALKQASNYEVSGCGCGEASEIFNHIETCYPLENIK